MKKKSLALIITILIMALACIMLVACVKPKPDVPPPPIPDPPKELTREDCSLVFGGDGIAIVGVLAPSDSDPSVGGAVSAIVSLKATGADLRITATMTNIRIVLKGGVIEQHSDEGMSQILTMTCNKDGVDLVKDVATDATFVFTMPATEDMKYMGATFSMTVKLTVTHANGEAV